MMVDVSLVANIFAWLPFECMQNAFMRQAMLALLLLCPMTAMLGVHVQNFRMSFFSDAVGHSAFAGIAAGIILGLPVQPTVLVFGALIGIMIMMMQRKSGLSADTAIGIVFSAVVAFGLAVVSAAPHLAREVSQYLYGDILTVSETEIGVLGFLFLAVCLFEILGWNRLLAMSLSPVLARLDANARPVWQYILAALLALVVMFAVRAVGVLLVTAMLIVPAAAARNFARAMGGVFWWAIGISIFSGMTGLLLSAQEWPGTASGATVILVACLCFAASWIKSVFAGD